MTNLRLLIMVLATVVASIPSPVLTQEGSTNNAAVLKQYFEPKSVTRLEWELMEFNILWQGSFTRDASYLTSFPVYFNWKAMRFQTILLVSENREHSDPEPFFRLPRPRRESILQGAVNQLKDLLGSQFPELNSNPKLLYVEFKFRDSGGGSSIVAKYENGSLRFSE